MEVKKMVLQEELKILNSGNIKDARRYFGMTLNKAQVTKELDRKVRKHMLECGIRDYEVAFNDVLANEPDLKERYYEVNFEK